MAEHLSRPYSGYGDTYSVVSDDTVGYVFTRWQYATSPTHGRRIRWAHRAAIGLAMPYSVLAVDIFISSFDHRSADLCTS